MGDVLVIAVSGRLADGGPDAREFGERVLPLVSGAVEGGHAVVFDFSRLELIDSIAERTMMIAARMASDARTPLVIASPQPLVQETWEISRFHLVIPVFASVDDAVLALAAPDGPASGYTPRP